MHRASAVGLISAALLAIGSAAPGSASAQGIDTRSILSSPTAGWLSPPLQHRPTFASCASPPGFGYGPFWSPWDARFSRYWFSPATRWYGSWAEWPGLGYGSYWPATGWGAWSPWPVSRGLCRSPGSVYRGFGLGIGLGIGYRGGYWGYGGYGNYWGYRGYGGYGGYAAYPDTWRPGGALGLDTGAGHVPESVRLMNGYRVIETRPTTGGADLRRIDPARLERSRAPEQGSRESVSERIRTVAERMAAERTAADRMAAERTAAERMAAPARREVRQPTNPAPSARPTPRSATPRSSAGSSRRAAPSARPAPKRPARATGSSARPRPKTRQPQN